MVEKNYPNPNTLYPIEGVTRTVYLKNIITNPQDGAIIGTNSLITKDVEPYTMVGGNPAKEIRKRFDDETIQLLLALKWWDWDVQKITDNLEVITGGKIDELKRIYEEIK